MNTKTYLPTTELSKYSSTRDTMEWLIGQTPQSGLLDQARDTLLAWASESCQGQGRTDRFVLLDPDKDISFHEVLSQMELDQAQRFIDELIEDIVPQMASQQRLLDASWLAGALEGAGTLDEIRELISSSSPQIQIEQLTWVDDHKRDAHINLNVHFQVDFDEDVKSDSGRKPKP